MLSVEDNGPQDVFGVIEKFEDEQDRLGYTTSSLILIKLIAGMLNSWKALLSSPIVRNSTDEELKSYFLFIKKVTKNMVIETEKLHIVQSQERRILVESGEFKPIVDKKPSGVTVV